MSYCNGCGNKLDSTDRKCPVCGQRNSLFTAETTNQVRKPGDDHDCYQTEIRPVQNNTQSKKFIEIVGQNGEKVPVENPKLNESVKKIIKGIAIIIALKFAFIFFFIFLPMLFDAI